MSGSWYSILILFLVRSYSVFIPFLFRSYSVLIPFLLRSYSVYVLRVLVLGSGSCVSGSCVSGSWGFVRIVCVLLVLSCPYSPGGVLRVPFCVPVLFIVRRYI